MSRRRRYYRVCGHEDFTPEEALIAWSTVAAGFIGMFVIIIFGVFR